MLLELAIGDAYGAGFEYVDTKMILPQNNLSGYVKHPRHHIQPGSYTDDTQMSLAIAEALAAGSCSTEIAQDLPAHLFDELENGQYGRDYIRLLDTQLMALKA